MSRILAPYSREVSSYIENANDFIEKVKEVKIDDNEVMVSFDVKSLFTSVPTEDAKAAITDLLESDGNLEDRTGLTSTTVLELLKLCLLGTSFKFRETHYELTDGLAMGSPSSPVIANLFMARLEKKAFDSFATPPKVWFRFVDDVFAIVRRAVVQALLHHLNQQHPSITFTMELEAEGKLPFLDLSVHRQDGALRTDVYRKPTHTGRYLSYTSNHPDSAKRSLVQSIFGRRKYITLGPDAVKKEEERLYADLVANGYPVEYIKRVAKDLEKSAQRENKPPVKGQEEQYAAVCAVPYVQGLSEAVRRILAPLQIRTVFRAQQWKWQLMNGAKDSVAPEVNQELCTS